MRAFTAARANGAAADDEIWLTSHPPVFTLGLDGNRSHLLAPGDIPVVETERGGQVTYHGPGQVIAYILIDLRARKIGIRTLVDRIEAGAIAALAEVGVAAHRVDGAPGLYVGPDSVPGDAMPSLAVPGAGVAGNAEPRRGRRERPAPRFAGARKIASIGLKVSQGFSFHGIAVNGQMDLGPFERIDPCGYPSLQMTDAQREAATHSRFSLESLTAGLGAALARTIAG